MAEEQATDQDPQDSPATKEHSNYSNKKLEELNGKQLAIKILERLEHLDERVSNIEEKMEEGKVEVINRNSKILEKYPEELKIQLVSKAFKEGNSGVKKDYVMDLFDVEEDQARKIMKKAGQQYDYLEWHYPGGPVSGKLYHKVSKEAESIAEIRKISESDLPEMETPKGFVLEEVEWNGDKMSSDSLSELQMIREDLEAQERQEQKEKRVKKKYGGLF